MAILQATDLTYLGCMRMPDSVDTGSGGTGMTARRVGGQLQFFIYGRNPTGATFTVTDGISPLVCTLTPAGLSAGDKIAFVRAANGNLVPESRRVQAVSGNQITLDRALGGTPASGDTVYYTTDYFVYELADTGSYNTDYTRAPQMRLVTAWPDIYGGRRVTWNGDELIAPMEYLYPGCLYWHEGNQLLYWTYNNAYAGQTHQEDWGLGATRLDNPATGDSTSYGPWRVLATDGDGSEWYGPNRAGVLFPGPDGSMGGHGVYNATRTAPWGPQFYAGGAWPTAYTPSGLGAPDLLLPDRYLEHYFMAGAGPNVFNDDGSVQGEIRSFRYPNSPNRPYLYEDIDRPVTFADPAKTGGICTWTEMNGLNGALWLELPTKRGVLFAASVVGSAVTDPRRVEAAHAWYRNAGVGSAQCSHGFGPPNVPDIAGPVTTAAFPALIFYNPDDLRAVQAGTQVDYAVNPISWIDLRSSFNLQTAGRGSLVIGNVGGFYFDPTRNYLFLSTTEASDSGETLLHVFEVAV